MCVKLAVWYSSIAVWQNSSMAVQLYCHTAILPYYYTAMSNKSEHTQVPLPNRSESFMEDINVLGEGVTKLLKGLNPSKALGQDELHPRVLIELASELGLMFPRLF